MAPRTRATKTEPLPALAAAPRRRVKVTPLEKPNSKPTTADIEPTVRKTRQARVTKDEIKVPATEPSKTRGRTKKDATVELEKPKRKTRSAPVHLKEEEPMKGSKASKTPILASELQENDDKLIGASKSKSVPKKTESKKKVTFQDVHDEKENVPVQRATRKTSALKATEKVVVGIKARPVRKNASGMTATKSTARKRTRDAAEEDKSAEQPSKKARALTPKKITQVARAATPQEESEDELNGGKTPVRDLSLSPRRPQSTTDTQAIAQRLSPFKKPNFTQQLVRSVQDDAKSVSASLASPARRPPTSPAKQVNTTQSPMKAFNIDTTKSLASPARRLPQSFAPQMSANKPLAAPIEASPKRGLGDASRLLFPNHNSAVMDNSRLESMQTLFQSPKRSAMLNPVKMFPHSAAKSSNSGSGLFKSSFLSSPAKRSGLFSPVKERNATVLEQEELESVASPQAAVKSLESLDERPVQSSESMNVDDMNVTELIEDHADMVLEEITVTSHQRASLSPLRPTRLSSALFSEEDQHASFDDSIFDIRSPLKVDRSPAKTQEVVEDDETILLPEVMNESTLQEVSFPADALSLHATPQKEQEIVTLEPPMSTPHHDVISQFTNLNTPSTVSPVSSSTQRQAPILTRDVNMDESTIVLDENELTNALQMGTPRMAGSQTPASSREEALHDTMSTRTPRSMCSPAALDESELTRLATLRTPALERSPAALGEHELTRLATSTTPTTAQTPAPLYEHELTTIEINQTPKTGSRSTKPPTKSIESPAPLNEHELTMIAGEKTPQVSISPASNKEDEFTVAAVAKTPKGQSSPVALTEHELTGLADMNTPRNAPSPAFLDEHELTPLGPSHTLAAAIPDSPSERFETMNEHVVKTNVDTERTPAQPVPRRLNIQTTVSRIPLKPAAIASPSASPLARALLKKRKRATSLSGGQSGRTPTKFDRIVSDTAAATSRSPLTSVFKDSSSFLEGASIFLDIWTSEHTSAAPFYATLIPSLGGAVTKSITEQTTHIVFKDGSSSNLDKAAEAITAGQNLKVVRISWILACQEEGRWVDESEHCIDVGALECQVTRSIGRSRDKNRRKSMEPSMLVVDGQGSVKRSRSKSRTSLSASVKRHSVSSTSAATPLYEDPDLDIIPGEVNSDTLTRGDEIENEATPRAKLHPSSRQPRESLSSAWRSVHAPNNIDMGADTPARKTLELLRRCDALEHELSAADESTIMPGDETMMETGLTPAPYKLKDVFGAATEMPGTAPAKYKGVEMMTMRERVEEMERREAKRGKDRRVTVFGNNIR